MLLVRKEWDAAVGNFLGCFLPGGLCKFLVERLVSTRRFLFRPRRALASRILRMEASKRSCGIRPDFAEARTALIGSIRNGRHEQGIGASKKGAHGSFAGA